MDLLTTSHVDSTLDFSTVYSTMYPCKILRQVSNARDSHGKGYYSGQRTENSNSQKACITSSSISSTPTHTSHGISHMGNNLASRTSGQEPIPSSIEHQDCYNAHRTLGMWPGSPWICEETRMGKKFSEEQTIFTSKELSKHQCHASKPPLLIGQCTSQASRLALVQH